MRWYVVPVMLLALTGCSADRTADPPAPVPQSSWDVSNMPNPCGLLPLDEVRRAARSAVAAGSDLDSWPPLCSYRLPGAEQEYLNLSADSRPAAADDFTRQHSDSAATEDITGLGDRAYWLPDYTALHVLAAGTHLTVSFAGPQPPPDVRARTEAVARAVLR